jgi:Sialic acid synthase
MKPIQEKIIAEVANVHEGSENYLKELVEKAKKSGLENIKFQYIIPGEFGKPKSASYIEFDRLKIKNNVFLEIIEQYSDIKFYFDVFGQESLNKVISLNQKSKNKIDGVKFHTTSSMDFTLIENAAKYFNKIIVSISGLLFSEIAQLVDFLKLNNFKNEVILSYGVQNYPTDIEDVKLMKLLSIKNIFNYKICISDHLPGGDDLSKDIIYYASLLDYDYIEKHISLDNNRGLDDDVAATNIEDFPLILEN